MVNCPTKITSKYFRNKHSNEDFEKKNSKQTHEVTYIYIHQIYSTSFLLNL